MKMKLKDLQKGLHESGIDMEIINATPEYETEEEIIYQIKEDIGELNKFVAAKDWTMTVIINHRIERNIKKMMERKWRKKK